MTNRQSYKYTIPIIFGVVVLDQVTKFLFTNKFYILIPNVLSIFYNKNTGAAWNLFEGKVVFLAILSIVFLIALMVFNHYFTEKNKLYVISYALIIGGAIGNLIDRMFFGYVRDFIQFNFINFPIFNLADTALTIGMICILIFLFFAYPSKEDAKEDKKWILKLWLKKKMQKNALMFFWVKSLIFLVRK